MRIIKCNNCHKNYNPKDFDNHYCKDYQEAFEKNNYNNSKYNQKTYDSQKYRRTLERQNTEVNLFSHLYLDTTENTKGNKNMNPFINSSIIQANEIQYIKELFTNKKNISFSLVYKLNRDTSKNFHNLCDFIGPNLSLFKIRKSSTSNSYNRFGGFTSLDWECSKQKKVDDSAFIFSLTKKKVFRAKYPYISIYCSINYGPCFGYQGLYSGIWTKGKLGGYDPCDTFGDKDRECTCGLKEFFINEIEVYKVTLEFY